MALKAFIEKDLRWRLADPISLLLWIGIPLLIGGLMSLAFGNSSGSTPPKPHLLVAGYEDPIFAKMLPSMESRWRVDKVDKKTGLARIAEGDGSALLVVPKDFGTSFLFDQETKLELITNPSQRILPTMIESELKGRFVDGQFYMRRLPFDVLTKMQDGGEDLLSALDKATQSSTDPKSATLRSTLFPLLLSVEEERTQKQIERAAAKDQPVPQANIGLLLFPGIMFMALMFMAQGISYDIWREKDQGTLARLLCSPSGTGTLLLAKILAGGILMAVVIGVALGAGCLVFGIRAATIPAALAWCTFAGMCILILFFVVQMLATTSRGANVLTTTILFPLMMLGGAFFPLDSMPQFLADIGRMTPNGLAAQQLEDILGGSVVSGDLLRASLILAATAAALFCLAMRMLRGRFSTT